MADLRGRQRQGAHEGEPGAVIRVLAPGRVAEPARRPVQASPRRAGIGKERRDPAIETLAVAFPSALGRRDSLAGSEQRIGARLAQQQPVGVTLAQPEGREHDPARLSGRHQPAQDQRGDRQCFKAFAIDRRDAVERAARLAGDDVEKGLRRLTRYRVFMDDVQRVLGLLHVQPRQRPPCAADRDINSFPRPRRARRRRRSCARRIRPSCFCRRVRSGATGRSAG